MMTKEELKAYVQSLAAEAEFEEEGQFLTAIISSKELHKVADKLKNDNTTRFDFLFCLTGVDYPEYLMVVYHLRSTELGHTIVIKAKIENREDPHMETVCDIWKTAEFHEREVYDLFGIIFDNHPDLRRIFLEDDWVGYPLRKDYVDDINIVEL